MLSKRCHTMEFHLYGNLENLDKIYNQQFPRTRVRWRSSVCMGTFGGERSVV